ncbi:MAG: DUF4115 domain-containing protein [Desertifilum sp.]|nr:DUF4115 domain-containing protein [Desertifilum sp.]MDI9637703.1 DUF4115 domain-containing protein [Geitlerinema splendidum]
MKKDKQRNSYHVEQAQRIELLTDLGRYLRQARQDKALSLAQVADQTRIPQRLLQALEDGQLDRLPEPIYIKCFLRRYADALGIDGEEFSSPFPTDPIQIPVRGSWLRLPSAQLQPIHLYLLYVALIFVSVNGLSHVVGQSSNQAQEQNSEEQVNPTASQESPVTQQALATRPMSATATLPVTLQGTGVGGNDGEPVRVSLKFNAQSWVRIEADGKTAFEGILPEGTQRTWVANQQLIIRAGNAGGVMVTLNDGQTQKLGEPGAVEEVTFKAKSRS